MLLLHDFLTTYDIESLAETFERVSVLDITLQQDTGCAVDVYSFIEVGDRSDVDAGLSAGEVDVGDHQAVELMLIREAEAHVAHVVNLGHVDGEIAPVVVRKGEGELVGSIVVERDGAVGRTAAVDLQVEVPAEG